MPTPDQTFPCSRCGRTCWSQIDGRSALTTNSVDKPVSLPYRRSTTVSSETNPLYSFVVKALRPLIPSKHFFNPQISDSIRPKTALTKGLTLETSAFQSLYVWSIYFTSLSSFNLSQTKHLSVNFVFLLNAAMPFVPEGPDK